MSTLTITVSDETARLLAADPEALRRAGEIIDAAFGAGREEPMPDLAKLSAEDEALITDRLERIESGELKETPWDSSARRKRAHELLKREFGWEGDSATGAAEAA